MRTVSFSQYGQFIGCEWAWKLNYVDNLKMSSDNEDNILGTGIHKILQDYITLYYNKTINEANEYPYKEKLMEYIEEKIKCSEQLDVDPDKMGEYYEDGLIIFEYFKKNMSKYFSKKNSELLGIEINLRYPTNNESIHFNGYIDIAIRDKKDGSIRIIDFKKSYRGWNDKNKKDKIKSAQLQLYKWFYAKQFDVDINKISVEYIILKQKTYMTQWGEVSRIQKFAPPHSGITCKKTFEDFQNNFINKVFDKNGEILNEYRFNPNPSKDNCKWCAFRTKKEHCAFGI